MARKIQYVDVNMDVIQTYLKSSRITQKEAADYIGVSLRTFAIWRIDNRMPADAFLCLCALFGWINLPNNINVVMPNGILM